MRVAAFIFNLSKGGAQGVFVNVVNYLYDSHIDLEVVVQNLDDAIYKHNLNEHIKIISLGVSSAKKLLPVLKNYLKDSTFTHALVFSPEITISLYIAKKQLKLNFKIIGRCLNTLTQEYNYASTFFRKYVTSNLIKLFYHKIDLVVAQSHGMAEDLIENWGFKESQVIVINNAMQFVYEEEMKSTIISEKSNYIMYAGRLEEQKGLKILLDVFSRISHKDIMLKLIGSGSLKNELIELADKIQISDRIEFLDYTPHIMEYYKHARVVVLTSYFEGFPNVLVEAIACGTPVVAFDLPSGPKEIILEQQNGYLVPYLDIEEFSKILDKALDMEWNQSIIKASAHRYAREKILPKYMKILEEM